MPHAFVKTPLPLSRLVELWKEQTLSFESIRVKIRSGYRNPEDSRALFPCLVIESGHPRWFYIEVRRKKEDRLLIHLDPITPVPRTLGVRLALAWFAQHIASLQPGNHVEPGNLEEFFDLLRKPPSHRGRELLHLHQKLARQMRAAQLREKGKKFFITLEGRTPPLRLEELFDNPRAVEIEIGPGKGKFLLSEAGRRPQVNFLAIEWSGRYLKVLSERLSRADLANVRLLQADARLVLREWLPHASVTGVHIYYPDPWWKKRHQKHRIYTPEFLDDLERALSPGGFVFFATDVEELYREMCTMMKDLHSFAMVSEKVYCSESEPPPGRSNFEIKKWQEGSAIFEARWQKNER